MDLGDLLVTWQRRGTRGGSWRPLLAHLGSRPERTRRIGLRAERRIPGTLDGEQVAAIVAACDRLRDRFLFTLLAETGLRIGEALGLRHSDIDAASRLVTVVPRANGNWARAKGGGRQVPVTARVIRLYSDFCTPSTASWTATTCSSTCGPARPEVRWRIRASTT